MTRFQFIEHYCKGIYPIEEEYSGVPYVDTLSTAIEVDGEYYLANGDSPMDWYYYDTLQSTDGSSDGNKISTIRGNQIWCDDINEYVDEDDATYVDSRDCYYRYTDNLVYIEGYGYYDSELDTDIAYDEYENEWSFKDDLHYCESEDIWTTDPNYVEVEDGGEYEGSYEPIDEYVYCDEFGCYIHQSADYEMIQDLNEIWHNYEEHYQHEDGLWYSYEEEIEEEEDEDEEAVA